MTWFFVTISAYFFLAIVSLFDRYFLAGPIPNSKTYTFYIGAIGFLACLVLLPFGINLSDLNADFIGIITGFARLLAILFLSISIVKSEISRVIPAVGGFLPIFSFFLFLIFFPNSGSLNLFQIAAFLMLVSGSVLISVKEKKLNNLFFQNFRYPVLSAFFFALTFFLSKKLYLETDFLSGLFLILLGGALGSLFFLAFSDVRRDIFSGQKMQKLSFLFAVGQITGGLGVFLQQYAVFLAKPIQVPLINAMEGLRYAFLLFFVIILSVKNPGILKEEISKEVIFQKIIAIALIGFGLAFLAF